MAEAKTVQEQIDAMVQKAQVAAAASENKDFQVAKMTSGRNARSLTRALNDEDREQRAKDGIADQLAKLDAVAALPKAKRDQLDGGKSKAQAEELKKAKAKIKQLEATTKKAKAKGKDKNMTAPPEDTLPVAATVAPAPIGPNG